MEDMPFWSMSIGSPAGLKRSPRRDVCDSLRPREEAEETERCEEEEEWDCVAVCAWEQRSMEEGEGGK